ncbi:energy transducer TonB [Novosphingobium bradum]|uniref:Energy transducer TonB n=1 Tax=Novosphingobium bradum TaxID=1737444 RepID=A0ABV7IK68_9SPHN
MTEADLSAPRPVRVAAFVAVGLLHVVVAVLLVRAFAPGFTAEVARRVVSTFSVTVTAPEPTPTPASVPAPAARAPEPAGAAGVTGRKARPREVAAPVPRLALARPAAPPVADHGPADRAGAASGDGTGAGGSGTGTGNGGSGSGTGGGSGTRPVKIAGDINSARDYPIASREARLGDHVVIWLTVGTDGRASACKVARASRDPAADAITCRLAMERFRFRPALDASGAPVVAAFGWQQRWFLKD